MYASAPIASGPFRTELSIVAVSSTTTGPIIRFPEAPPGISAGLTVEHEPVDLE